MFIGTYQTDGRSLIIIIAPMYADGFSVRMKRFCV